jgi:ubiquinone/menaquinone biosynthesis C-methylase UbiE
MPLHVRQVEDDAAARGFRLRTAVGDARDLDLSDASVDAVLLLGPLYHLRRRADRLRALGEARRVVRPSGCRNCSVSARTCWPPGCGPFHDRGQKLVNMTENWP